MLANNSQINILLIEDENFDVKRIKNTINYYENILIK
jgi:hypothetical protein